MKQLLLVFVLVLTFASCDKQASNKLAPKQMTYEELTKNVGSQIAFLLFDRAGKTEASPIARGEKRVKAGATLETINDLQLTNEGGGNFKTTLSANWVWAGINTGQIGGTGVSISFCNVNNPSESHPETTTGVLICNTTSSGTKLGWASDADYTVHLSNVITI